MKKSILFLTLLFSSVFMYAQITYYWIGGPTGASGSGWNTGSNWNTQLDGLGTTRTTPTVATTDILIVDGNNIGGATPTTGSITIKVSGSSLILNINQLKLINNANLTLQRITAGTSTVTINGDNGDDFVVDATSNLTLIGTAPSPDSSSVRIIIGAASTGRVGGSVTMSNWGSRIITSNPVSGGALIFESGSIANVNTYEAGSYPFGSGSSGTVSNAVVFNAGSKLYYKGGNSIFSNTSTFSPINFISGSELIIAATVPNIYCASSNLFAGRRFANLTISSGQSAEVDIFSNVDNLTVQSGATLKLKTTGAFPISGNIINDGLFKVNTLLPNVSGTSNLLFKGNSIQTVGGTGLYDTLGVITVSANAHVLLNTDLKLFGLNSSGTSANTASVVGILNLNNHVITGTTKFQTREAANATTAVTTGVTGTNTLTLDASAYNSSANTANVAVGVLVTGTGVPANTYIVGTSSGTSTITLSNNLSDNVTSVTLSNNAATLKTAHLNGIDGALVLSGGLSLGTGTNYEFNGPTNSPFSLSTNNITGNITCNAPITTNKNQSIGGVLTLNSGNFTIRALDTIRLRNAYNIGGAPFTNTKHIVNEVNAGNIGVLRMDSILSNMLLPIGSSTHYLPVSLSYANTTNVYVSAFEGITQDATISGTPFSATELQKVVNAVWDIKPTSSAAVADNLQLGWDQSLEGSIFTTLANSQIGIIKNDGTTWGQPLSTGDNSLNTASLSNDGLGLYSIGSLQQTQINNFVFNTIPNKTYGDADFSNIATSQNITQPITYSSSNTSVATVSSTGLIHIVGAGTTNIIASQLGDGVYTDTSISRSFTVDKANLTITANNITRNEGVANPALTVTYSGFVNGENNSILLTPAVLNTTAIISSTAGTYPITVSGATAANYTITFVSGTLTVEAVTGAFTFNAIPAKTYGDADFSNTASSQNITQSIIYTSSNTAVATISSAGLIHIVGAGTTDITASQATDGTYPAASVTRAFVVNKANLTITANNITRNEGVANPALTVTYSGFVNGENNSILLTPAVLNTTAIISSTAGAYPITVSGATAANYTITFVSGTLNVEAVTGAFTFNTIPAKTYGDADFSNTASSQNITQSIIYTSSNTAVATISSAGLIHIVGAGTTDITASQATDGTYPAASVTRAFVVNKANLTITANNITRNEGVANPLLTATYSGFVNGENSSVLLTPEVLNTSATQLSPAGIYPITVSVATAANYNITFVAGTLTVVAIPTTGLITYFWVGGTGSVQTPLSFSSTSKWNTILDGSGVARPSGDSTGILIIDGSNVGGATPVTGNVFAYSGSTKMSQLILRNGANLTLSRITTGNSSISIKGDSATSTDDLLVNSGCSLTINVADSVSSTSGHKLLITSNATGTIYGAFALNGGTCRVEQTNPVLGGALFFENGSVCNVNTQVKDYPFGSSNGVNYGVVFRNGSKLVYKGGKSFFRASSSSIIPIVLQQGNTCRFEASVPNSYSDSSMFFSKRNYSNVEIAANVSVNAADFYNIDNLTIETGATFNLKGSGTSPVSGSILNNGTFGAVSGFTSSILLMKGNTLQTIGGTGVFTPLGSLVVAAKSNVELNANLIVNGTSNAVVHGKLNLKNSTITGTGTLQTKAAATVSSAVTTSTVGSHVLTLPSITGISTGMIVTGAGIPAGSYVIGSSSSASTITISDSVQSVVSSIDVTGSIPVIETSNANGVDGSIGGVGSLSLTSSTDYIFDGATAQPFSLVSPASARNITINAAVTSNKSQNIDSTLTLASGIFSIRPTDTIIIKNGNDIGGAPFSASKYIVTQNDGFNIGVLRIDGANNNEFFPVGSATHYLPVSMKPVSSSTLTAAVFEGVTANGALNGTLLTSRELQPYVNAVWKLNRVSGTGNIDIKMNWEESIEGPLFSSSNNAVIGITKNISNVWGAQFGTPDSATNSASATVSSLGLYTIHSNSDARFVFNPFVHKTYGDNDFVTSTFSKNTIQPIVFSSSDPLVATVSTTGVIHIVGVGATNITASQLSDGVYADSSITRVLIVDKADLTITADDKSKIQGDANPPLTVTYSGFVNGENESILYAPIVVATTASQSSPKGAYPITILTATAANYNINFIPANLIVYGFEFAPIPVITYGDRDTIKAKADTSNPYANLNSMPIKYVSSDTLVATVDSLTGVLHIVGVGTTDITAFQASDGTYPAASITRTLTVIKRLLNIKVADTVRFEGDDNPNFRFIYSGFAPGENETVLTVLPFANTIASRLSTPGVYGVTPDGAQAANYSFTYTSGLLTVYPKDMTQQIFNVYYSNGAINVKVFSPEADLSDILLYSIKGQFMMRKNIFVNNGFTSAKIEVNNIASGNYVVIYKGKKMKKSKLITIIK